MKKSNLKVVSHGSEHHASIESNSANDKSNPLVIIYDEKKEELSFSCRGGCHLVLNEELIDELKEFFSKI